MLTVNKVEVQNGLRVELQGAIEESVNLDQLIGPFQGSLTVNCRGITRINSIGVKTWMRYFQGLRFNGKYFEFEEVPHPVIEQLNMIANFECGGKVVSILLPFSCTKCQSEFVASCQTKEIVESGFSIPVAKCEKTDCGARFDDDPDEYFYFLEG